MHSVDLENLSLLIVRDAAEAEMWTERWACSYPVVQTAACRADDTVARWQQQVQAAVSGSAAGKIMLVAHGAGVPAAAAWYAQADILTQKRIVAAILAAPVQAAFRDDPAHTLQRVRFNCKAALVAAVDDPHCPQSWAAELADRWHARLLHPPQSGHLNGRLGGWQWGMRLMQEMLLA